MTALLLHIGSPKAGSSAIQASLLEAESDLRQNQGVIVLPPNPYRRPLPSGFLAACHLPVEQLPRYLAARQSRDPVQFQQDLDAYRQLVADLLQLGQPSHPQPWKARWQRMRASAFRHRCHPALVSSEYLWRLPVEEICRLRKFCEDCGVRQFRVLVYVREPVSAYASFLQQWSRLSDDLRPYNPLAWRYRFREYIQAWSAVFAPQELVVRPFRRDHFEEGSIVKDFYAQCSSFLGSKLVGPEPRQMNESFSVEALLLVHQLLASVPLECRQKPGWTSNMARFLRLLRRESSALKCTPVQLQPWVSHVVWKQHCEDLEWLHQVYGIAFDQPDFSFQQTEPLCKTESLTLTDLLLPPSAPDLVETLGRRQLEAVVREGLS